MQTCEATRIEELEDRIGLLGSAVVAFSGGVDSSLVAALAARALGDRALAVTAVSPALATGELDGASLVAAAIGIRHETITTAELEREEYRRNDHDRCYHCKTELYSQLVGSRRPPRLRGAALGRQRRRSRATGGPACAPPRSTASSIRCSRPGSARRRSRELARALGVPSAEKPASPCLASRLPVRDAGRARDARAGRPRRAGAQGARLPRAARPSLTASSARVELAGDELPRALSPGAGGRRRRRSRRRLRRGRDRPGAVPLRLAQRGLRGSAPGQVAGGCRTGLCPRRRSSCRRARAPRAARTASRSAPHRRLRRRALA